VPGEQLALAGQKRRVLRRRRQGELDADELGALGLAVLLAPVGERQPRHVVARLIENRPE
jgi:hypothetical protein